ncbi:hypothetical protein KFL_003630130 [Klebsormidium nitens]|uniref:FAS1 domain-containing protein n=1 Tax=Klebsormidium nitens TaxID=105231 RepID=A0A1Y1I9E8_KLENI|nr:hypothetical protein KFL_003630130 [Klebsormidium nitens]|eukprot:GAQ87595.1 hypothetical protein KFL_003630130 [Klebsormidium nitens]
MAPFKSPLVPIFLGLLLSFVLASAQPSDEPSAQPFPTSTPNFLTQGSWKISDVDNYVNTTALVAELRPPATLFAPTDAAFSVIPPNVVEGLKENPDILTNLISYHFVKGFLPAAVLLSFPNGQVTSVFRNQTINTTVTSDGSVFVGVSRPLAKVTQADIFLLPAVFATHGISMVLTPQRFVVYGEFARPAFPVSEAILTAVRKELCLSSL